MTQYRGASTDEGATAQTAKLNPEATLINLKQQRGYYLNILIQYNLPQFSNCKNPNKANELKILKH